MSESVNKLVPPEIVFEDNHLMVVNKPAGWLSQGEKKGDPHIVEWASNYLGRPYVGLIHRLDRNTSGLMVLGKRTKASGRLSDALKAGKLHRAYLAWVVGALDSAQEWEDWLQKDPKSNLVKVVRAPVKKSSGDSAPKWAKLHVEPLKVHLCRAGSLSLARFVLETGRSHQIRVQAASRGHALMGDRKYGLGQLKAGLQNFGRPALHSAQMSFPHPMEPERILQFEAPLPRDMAEVFHWT